MSSQGFLSRCQRAIADSDSDTEGKRSFFGVKGQKESSFGCTAHWPNTCSRIAAQVFTGRLHHAFAMSRAYRVNDPDPSQSIHRDRARCAWSLLCCLAQTLEALFTTGTSVKHIINSIVPDDTTTRLRGPNPGDRTMVYTLMNTCQSCIVNYEEQLDNSGIACPFPPQHASCMWQTLQTSMRLTHLICLLAQTALGKVCKELAFQKTYQDSALCVGPSRSCVVTPWKPTVQLSTWRGNSSPKDVLLVSA